MNFRLYYQSLTVESQLKRALEEYLLGVQRASARLDARLARAIFSSFWEAQSSIFFFEPRLELGSARVLKESSRVLEDLDLRTWDENESRVLL